MRGICPHWRSLFPLPLGILTFVNTMLENRQWYHLKIHNMSCTHTWEILCSPRAEWAPPSVEHQAINILSRAASTSSLNIRKLLQTTYACIRPLHHNYIIKHKLTRHCQLPKIIQGIQDVYDLYIVPTQSKYCVHKHSPSYIYLKRTHSSPHSLRVCLSPPLLMDPLHLTSREENLSSMLSSLTSNRVPASNKHTGTAATMDLLV